MRMKKSKAIIYLILIAIFTGLLAFTSIKGFGKTGTGAAKNIHLGLDLEGGVSITYQVKDKNPSVEDMDDTVYKLQKRVEGYSTESSVYKEGTDRISIEIPGVTDAESVLNELGKPGSLYFIRQKDDAGNENYKMNDSGIYELAEGKNIDDMIESGDVVITGSEVEEAKATQQQNDLKNNENVVSLKLNDEGTEKFAEATKVAKADNQSIGIYYDGEFISVPNVQAEIVDGQAVINGMKNASEAEQLASSIRIGGLSLELEELRSNVVGAQLGQSAVSTSIKAGIIGLIVIFLFMIFVYRIPGLASSIALAIYTFMELVLLNAFDITLTLPGIAGIILSIGMAVDANVIIFARVKEEIATGKSINKALKSGFQKAFSAIMDGNVTTLIAAAVLWIKGSGSVKGFAQTLALGIVLSLFTALVVTRIIIYAFYAVGMKNIKLYGLQKERNTIDFVGKAKIWVIIAGVAILTVFGSMIVNKAVGNGAFNYSLEFRGGAATTVTMPKDMDIDELDKKVAPVVEKAVNDANVQISKVAGGKDVIIKTKTLSLKARKALNKALVDKLKVKENKIATENISSTVSSEMKNDAVVALIIAGILMLLYIWIRFSDINFALSAVMALAHDVIVVIGCYALIRLSVGNTFIACLLTIVGYSINATIVIFDRIRETLGGKSKKNDIKEVVNKSITYTLTRSIYTSFTTFVMVFMLYILGVSSVKEFALPLMVGVVAGGFSSVFLTGNIWYLFRTKVIKKK